MELRLFRLRFRRQVRKQRRQVEDLGQQAEQNIEQNLLKRFDNLLAVRRFVLAWVLLFMLLIGWTVVRLQSLSNTFQTLKPVPGGIYNEGILGTFTTANPMYAVSDVDTTVSHLVFAGLFTYDQHNQLVGDLAEGYKVDDKGITYTVKLRPNLVWQDGQPLTSQDVLFTYQAIQNPDAGSPFESAWQGIVISAPDKQTVVFTLPNPLAAFPYNLTSGLVPKHLLAGVPMVDLRTADFNTLHPVGAGPFAWQALEVTGNDPAKIQDQIALVPFERYHRGAPKLKEFIMHSYADREQLIAAFQKQQLTAITGLNNPPVQLGNDKNLQIHSILLTAGNYVFFKTSSGILSDAKVRQALVQAANPPAIIRDLNYQTAAVKAPLLPTQLAYDPSLTQATGNLVAAQNTLDQAGWTVSRNGLRAKNGQTLSFAFTALNTPENRLVTRLLQRQWLAAGVKLEVRLQNPEDFTTTLNYHDYDAILYGISLGVDPDVFVYWDSSQADIRAKNRLNLSEYRNATADAALEAGRTRLDPALRIIKYKPFLQAWQQDAPALGLYQPRFLYLTHGHVFGLSDHVINSSADRLNNVVNWQIRQAKITN